MREQARIDAQSLRVLARRDVATALAGAYRSAFRGRGLAFEELRDYVSGDDVRSIEWNATARFARPIVKRMREERDLVVALLVDVSSSLWFGSSGATKRQAVLRTSASLAYAAIAAQDRVALATFAEGPLERIDPGRGPVHLERLFQALGANAEGAPTDAGPALSWATRTLPRHSVVFLVSDLLFPDPGAPLRRCARKHELVVLRVADPADALPRKIAPIRARPIEGGGLHILRSRTRDAPFVQEGFLSPADLRGLGVEVGTVWTGPRLIPSLRHFLESRTARGA